MDTLVVVGWVYLILLHRDDAIGDELFCVLPHDPLLLLDLLVHQRLGEHGLVHLVMAVTSVAHLRAKTEKLKRDQAPARQKKQAHI